MNGYDINGRMRALLVDWLIQVHSRFQLLQETLYMTVAILDRFLQVCKIVYICSRINVACSKADSLPSGPTSDPQEATASGGYCNVDCL